MRVEGAIEKAIELCNEAIPLLPGSSLPRRRIGQYLMLSGKYEEALAAFEATVREFPNDADAWAVLGSAQLEVNLKEACAQSFERVVALRPKDGESWRALGEAQAAAKHDARALEAFLKAVEIDPSDKDSWRNLMLIKARHSDTSSRDAAARVIAIDPNDEASLAIYAAATKEAGDFPAAVAGYERLVARYPWKAVYWRDLAGAREGMHDKPGVIAALYQVVTLDRKNAEAWMILGFDTCWENRFAEAIFTFECYLALNPRDPGAWFELGYAREQVGKIPGAIEALQKGLLLDPLNPAALETLARLQESEDEDEEDEDED